MKIADLKLVIYPLPEWLHYVVENVSRLVD